MRSNRPSICVLLAAGVLVCSRTAGAATINVGTIVLQPDQAGQLVEFFASGSENVGGLEFDIQVADGGPDIGGTNTGPRMTAIDLVSGSPFDGNSPSAIDVVTFDRARQSTIDIFPNEVPLSTDALIATVTFDTVGIPPGTFPLLLSGVAGNSDTKFFDGQGAVIATIVTNGEVTIVPEPASAALCLFSLAVVLGLFARERGDRLRKPQRRSN